MKRTLLYLVLLFPCLLQAQDLSISGTILDQPSASPLPGAHIELLYPWEEAVQSTVTNEKGQFTFKGVEKGGYKLKVSFLGYGDYLQEVTLTNADVDLGQVSLTEGSVDLDAVEVKEKLPLAQQEGDTTSYNANAFKTLKDASAEDMLKKMPGVIENNGRLQVQGENIGKVLVDGRAFFGNDPNAALKNLPSEVISKIQVFDQASDQSQFTGFNDGNTTKTINIVTKSGIDNANFGKLYAGYGTDGRYQAGGNTSFFDGNRRISIIGQANNINQQNFASEDLLGVVGSNRRGRGGRGGGSRGGGGRRGGGRGGGVSANDFLVDQSGGVATTNAFGINYSDKLGKKFNLSASYFFNNTDNTAVENSATEFIDAASISEFYLEDNQSNSDNFNHRLNGRMDYRFSDNTSLIMRPQLSFQNNKGLSNTIGKTLLGEQLLNSTTTDFLSDLSAVNLRNNWTLRHRLKKRGRTISLGVSNTYTTNKGESQLNSESFINRRMMAITDTLNQLSDLDIKGWQHSASLNYTEPIGSAMLMLSYEASLQDEESDKRTFDFRKETQLYDQLNEPLSSVFTNEYWTHRLGAGIRIRQGREFFAIARANAQWSYLNSDESFPNQLLLKRNYFNVVPFGMIRYNISKEENLRVFYRSNTQIPSIQQLQNVIDNSNPLQLSIGNPNLDQSFNHSVFMRYSKSNLEKATVFFLMLRGTLTQNYVGNSIFLADSDHPIFSQLNVQQGTQLSQPINVDGYKNYQVFSTYGFPIKPIKTNVNLDLSANLVKIPGYINEQLNTSDNQTLTMGVTFASNISHQVDFTISSRSSFNQVENTLRSAGDVNYLSQKTALALGIVFPKGIVYRTNFMHQFYDGLSASFDQSYFLWNMSLGIKMLKEQRGELAVTVFDLLNQNQSISRTVTDVYIADLRTNVLQQYFMLKFTYNFRNFNSGKEREVESREERRKRWMGM